MLRKVWLAICDECLRQGDPVDGFDIHASRYEVATQYRKEGWLISARRSLCPDCNN